MVSEAASQPTVGTRILQSGFILTVGAFVIGGVLMLWKVATPVEIHLSTSQLEFVVAPDTLQTVEFVKGLPWQLVTVEGFESLVVHPQTLTWADPKQYDGDRKCYPTTPKAWEPLDVASTIKVKSREGKNAQMILLPPGESECAETGSGITASGELKSPITIEAGAKVRLGIEGEGPYVLSFIITGKQPRLFLTLPAQAEMRLHDTQWEGEVKNGNMSTHAGTYRIEADPENATLEVQGAQSPLIVNFLLSSGLGGRELNNVAVPVTALSLTYWEGQTEFSTLLGEGKIMYPSHLNQAERPIKERHHLILGELKPFHIRTMKLDPSQHGFGLKLEGTAGTIETGLPGSDPDYLDDQRLSQFDFVAPWIQRLWGVTKAVKEVTG